MDREFFLLHSDMCKTLANAKRQMILGAMRDGERSVTELAERTGIKQANLSQHLSRMRSVGVVRCRQEGNKVFYSIGSPKLLQAFDLITEVLKEATGDRATCADALGDIGVVSDVHREREANGQ